MVQASKKGKGGGMSSSSSSCSFGSDKSSSSSGKLNSMRSRSSSRAREVAIKFFGYYCLSGRTKTPRMSTIMREIKILEKLKGVHAVVQIEGYFNDTEEGLISGLQVTQKNESLLGLPRIRQSHRKGEILELLKF